MKPEHAWVLDSIGAEDAEESSLDEAFAQLARLEERDGPRDAHGRFRAAATSLDLMDPPLERLRRELGLANDGWLGGTFALALTHDVDVVRRWTRRGVKGALWRARHGDRRQVLELARAPLHKLRGSDPWWRFRELVEAERERGVRSTFFVLGGHRAPEDGPGWGPLRRRLVETLREADVEIGLHPSYVAAQDRQLLAAEKRDLEALAGVLGGARFHYLRVDPHRNLRWLDELGFEYDASVGYADAIGFRAGIARPFRPWDLTAARPLDLIEIPTIAMDATLAEPRYLGLDPRAAEQRLETLLDLLAECGGACAVIWHTDRFDPATARGWDRLYFRLIDAVRDRAGVCVTAGDLAEAARARLSRQAI
jgi:peptidoglycan/xylan/chitin deacetylase (PgdA/CDA1 family)